MKFREATVNDIGAMSKVRLSVEENVLSNSALITLQMYEDYLEKLGRGWVCEDNEQIIGFSYAVSENNSIWALFVLPENEGKGVGKELLKLATEWLFSSGVSKVSLSTEINTRADGFYKSQGWIRGAMKDDYEVIYTLLRPY